EARSALVRRGQGLCREAAHHPALSRHLRRRHGEGQPARRRERVGAQARRQIEILEDGGTIEQETRLFDPDKGETRPMRNKEEAHDYRYFPDPDLLPLELTQDEVDALKAKLPELPDAKK